MQKQVLVFDLDNTLILRDKAMLRCIESVFEIQLNEAQKKAIEQRDDRGHSDRIIFCEWLRSFLILSPDVDTIWQSIRSNIGYFVRFNKDTETVLSSLQKDYELILLTNGGTENQQRKIKQTELEHFFQKERIFISESIGYSKPNPKAFEVVEKLFDEGTQFYMIGDHWEKDILGAINFGWRAIYLSPKKKGDFSNEKIKCISSLSALKKALNEFPID